MVCNALRSIALVLLMAVARLPLSAQGNTAAAPAVVVTRLGAVRGITESGLSLATDKGGVIAVKLAPDARLYRVAPGQTDLKGAQLMERSDLQVGDRVLVRGKVEDDSATVEASTVLVMKQQDIARRQQQELLDWQRRSVGGVVTQIDLQAGTVTVSEASAAGSKSIVVRTTFETTYKRYAPDSVKWEDAVSARLEDIHPGDQLRAKGNKSADGTVLDAEEVVAGTFRNIAGVVTAIDAAQRTLTIQDLATKKQVTVKVTGDSQMKKLPAEMAQRLAMRAKGAPQQEDESPATARGTAAGAHRAGDLNQMLGRLPAVTLSDLHKGEAVMIVSTMGSAGQLPTAVTLLGGVEAILAAPHGREAESLLTPWSLASVASGEQP